MTVASQVGASEWSAISRLVDRLRNNYPEVPADTVATVVHHNHARFDGRPVRDFVPLFVERGAKEELTRLRV
ncbi:MAG: hypothetical protein QOF67_2666 [Mycobacterium sp.]|jgi:hypothetical protein|nr:hypothetical protein [Mycobacterium sp.]